MPEVEPPGMQEQALESEAPQLAVEVAVAVLVVAGNRVADMRRVDARLMGTAGEQLDLDQRRAGLGIARARMKPAGCGLAVLAGLDHVLAAALAFLERGRHGSLAAMPETAHQGEIALADAAGLQRLVQSEQRRPALGNQQATGRFAVEAVRQLKHGGLRSQGTQRLDEAVGHPAAGVHRETGRLVHGQQMLVLVQYPLFEPAEAPRRRWLGRGRLAHRRQAHDVAGLQAVIRFGAAAVHPHLALAHQPVNPALGHAPEGGQKKIVEALAGAVFVDFNVPDRGMPVWGRFFHGGR